MKSFRGANIVSAAILGKQPPTVREILTRFSYQITRDRFDSRGRLIKYNAQKMFTIFGKDVNDNNLMHHAYIEDQPEIRQILRDFLQQVSNLQSDSPVSTLKTVALRMNRKG